MSVPSISSHAVSEGFATSHSSRGMVFPFQCLTYVKKILVRMEERAKATKEDIHAAVSHNGLEKIASKV